MVEKDGHYTFEDAEQTIGSVKAFYGNFLVVVRALCYMKMLGGDGMRDAAQTAVLNANYLKKLLEPHCDAATPGLCMHEFVLTMEHLKKETGVSAMDVAKSMLDYGMHPPTMYFPLIVPEALMFEPTETESKETLDWAAQTIAEILERAHTDPESLHASPTRTPIRRPDEVRAARTPKLRYSFDA